MRFERDGDGPPLLLVHGIGMSAAAWADVVPRLRERFDVVAVDLPGFGASPPLPGPPTLPALADACAALMRDELGLASWSVAGNSLGGGIAVHLALSGQVRAACALSPVGFTGPGLERLLLQGTVAAVDVAAPLLRAVVPPLPAPLRRTAVLSFAWHGDRIGAERLRTGFADLVHATGTRETRRHAFRWRAPDRPGALPCPLTIAWGEHDLLLLAGPQSARARERLPAAMHVSLPDAGHLPGWDDPAGTAAAIAAAVG